MHAPTKGRARRAKSAATNRPVKPRPAAAALRIVVANEQSILKVKAARLVEAVRVVLAGEGVAAAEISIAVVDDPTIHAINRDFLQHDFATDVITFALGDEGGLLEGEIVVSAETARTVAGRHGVEPADELVLYLIHGALHLTGYDDLSSAPRARMRAREQHYLAALGLELVPVDAEPPRAKIRPAKSVSRQVKQPSRGGRGGTKRRRSTNGTHGASAT
ncbi:MAG: rRNA maturation RNase YbeY [Pirellulales bacterium]|nr:rRNA maturation RNase YbeY [Pirellulales bacterium]